MLKSKISNGSSIVTTHPVVALRERAAANIYLLALDPALCVLVVGYGALGSENNCAVFEIVFLLLARHYALYSYRNEMYQVNI